jgi:3-isopropylmalate/(R)-2-methylmalate dehydratase large subunit
MTTIHLNPRVLFLSDDPDAVERQLQGEDLPLVDAGALRDNISTDEITPATVATIWTSAWAGTPTWDSFPEAIE